MRASIAFLLALALAGCEFVRGSDEPGDEGLAQFCGVTVDAFRQAKAEFKAAKPYDGREVGNCTLIKDDTGKITTASIRQPPKATN